MEFVAETAPFKEARKQRLREGEGRRKKRKGNGGERDTHTPISWYFQASIHRSLRTLEREDAPKMKSGSVVCIITYI
jgi:hypothetical protein